MLPFRGGISVRKAEETIVTPSLKSTRTLEVHLWDRLPRPLHGVSAVVAGTASAALATGVCAVIASVLPDHAVAVFYLLTVVASAVAFGMLAGIATATTAFFAYNYFFLQPAYTLAITDSRDLFALLMFFAAAFAAASLAGRLREVAEQARQKSLSLEALNALASRLADARTDDEIARALVTEASQAARQPAVILMRGTDGALKLSHQTDDAAPLNTADLQAAERSAATRLMIYPVATGWQGSHLEFRPVIVRDAVAAVLGVQQESFDGATNATLDAMVSQIATALERMMLETEKASAERLLDDERLRSALLSSISHDIKTPLASIHGAVTSLRQLGSKMPETSQSELLATIEEETVRLSRFVTNILDMMRLQSEPMDVAQDWIDLADTLGATVAHARRIMPGANLSLNVLASPAIVRGDETLLDHVVFNVIENAVTASAIGAPVKITLHKAGQEYRVAIEDEGDGIAPDVLPRIFDKFYRAPGSAARGSGLGLTICKDLMSALGGRVTAESPISGARGTRMTLHFPLRPVATDGEASL